MFTPDRSESLVEDLLRDTLVKIAKDVLGWDVAKTATAQPLLPIIKIFEAKIQDFSKYKLAKAYVRWSRDHDASELQEVERSQWSGLIAKINAALK